MKPLMVENWSFVGQNPPVMNESMYEMIYEKNHSSNRLIRNTEELHLWPQSIRRDFPYFAFRFSLIIWAEFIKLQVYCKVARD